MKQPKDNPAQLIEIKPGMYVRQEIDNIGWADMGDGILVIDALEKAELENEVMRAIATTVPGKKVATVINTHTHYDHVALNDAFSEKHNAEIVNYRTRDIPENGLLFEGGGRECRFIPIPGGHTREDCVAWFPRDSTLFVGDIFGWGLITCMGNAKPEIMTGLEAIYNRLIDFGADNVVPGHGPLCSTAELIRCRDYHEWLVDEVKDGIGQGRGVTELVNSITVPEDMQWWWRLNQWKHEHNVRKLVKAFAKQR